MLDAMQWYVLFVQNQNNLFLYNKIIIFLHLLYSMYLGSAHAMFQEPPPAYPAGLGTSHPSRNTENSVNLLKEEKEIQEWEAIWNQQRQKAIQSNRGTTGPISGPPVSAAVNSASPPP